MTFNDRKKWYLLIKIELEFDIVSKALNHNVKLDDDDAATLFYNTWEKL